MRPLAATNKAANDAIASLVAQVAKAVGKNLSEMTGAQLISSEQLKRDIKDINEKILNEWKTDCATDEKLRKKKRGGYLP